MVDLHQLISFIAVVAVFSKSLFSTNFLTSGLLILLIPVVTVVNNSFTFYVKLHHFIHKIFYVKNFISNFKNLNHLSANPTNGQTHSNNSPPLADELFECVCSFRGVGA